MKGHLALMVLVAALFLIALGPGLWGPTDIAEWYSSWQRAVFASVCHQQPSRSFWMNGAPLAVCERCFGIYFGLLLGVSIAFIHHPSLSFLKPAAVLAVILLSMDGFGSMFGIWDGTPSIRVGTGLAMGLIGGFLLVSWRRFENPE